MICPFFAQSEEKETWHFTAVYWHNFVVKCSTNYNCTRGICGVPKYSSFVFPTNKNFAKLFYVAIWCPFECVSWMRGKHCVIGLGSDLMIRATSLWNHYTSHTQRAKLLQQWTQKLCAVSPAWDETNDSCGHI